MTSEAATAAQGRRDVRLARDGLPAAIGLAAATAALAAGQAAYFPPAWKRGAPALAWAAGLALAFAPRLSLSRAEVALLALLGAFAVWIALSLAWSPSTPATVD